MKTLLALAIAVILLMVMTPIALAAGSGATVYVSVSVDGQLLVAAQPVSVTDMTVEAVIKAAHEEYYSGGLSGYTAGIDPMFNMYLVTQCWGVQATPYVILNNAPLGADPSIPPTVDAAPVAANDNIIICTSNDPMNKPATPVSLTATLSGDSATVKATAWTLDFMTFTYSSEPFANANVIDPVTGTSLGTTDADGTITVTVPESGIVAIDGLAAINVAAPVSAPAGTTTTPAGNVIPYTDAKNHIGETVTIQDKVFEKIDDSADSMWILFLGGPSTDPNSVGIEVKYSDLSKFPSDLYVGQTISITGELHANPVGGASFSLTDPSQVQVGGAPATAPAAPAGPITVYVSVSVDGKLLVAAKPVTVTDMTVQGAIEAAHEEYYSGGLSGYTAGIDPMFNMLLITQCWGVQATPFVILNNAPLGADPSIPPTVDAAPVVANDNIIICTSSDPMNRPATPVSLTSTLSGDSATLTATAWTLDFMTFMYSSAPLAGANVIDPATGDSLGTTDADGTITVTVPESGIVAIDGLAAINVAAPAPVVPAPTSAAPGPGPGVPATEDYPWIYEYSIILIVVGAIILIPVAVIVIVKMVRQSRLDKLPAAAASAYPAPIATAAAPISTLAAAASTSAGPTTVYVSVSVDGKLLVAAQPVTVTDLTVHGAIKAAHAKYYPGGESGYTAGIDPTFNMFLITKCWGIKVTPYVILNGAPLGANPAVPPTVDAAPVAANDNIIICTSSDMMSRPATPVSLTSTLSGDSVTVTAIAWMLNLTTFTYSSTPLANANVIDPVTGASLGTTDVGGRVTATVPESGVVAVDGLAAIAVVPRNR